MDDDDEYARDAAQRGLLKEGKSVSLEDILNEKDDEEEEDEELLQLQMRQQQRQQEYLSSLSSGSAQASQPATRTNTAPTTPTRSFQHPGTRSRADSATSVVSMSGKKTTGFDVAAAKARRRKHGAVVHGHIMKRLSQHLNAPTNRNAAGLPAVMDINPSHMAVGTSRGLVLVFDAKQTLQMTLGGENINAGAVTAVAISLDSTRLLSGYERGLVVRWDLSTGRILNTISDAHTSPVLRVAFTDDRRIAVSHEAKGTIHMYQFKRIIGVRSHDRTCVLHAERKPVSTMAVLRYKQHTAPTDFVMIAVAATDKLYLITLRPRLQVVHTIKATGVSPASLPCLAWNFVTVRARDGGLSVVPVLAFTWGHRVHFLKAAPDPSTGNESVRVSGLTGHYTSDVPVVAVHWMTERVVLALDANEHAHIVDVQANQLVDMLDLSHVELVFNTRFTKERRRQKGQLRDYSSGVATFDGFVYLVGLRGVHLLSVASWQDRIKSLMKQNLYVEAIALGLTFYDNTALAAHRIPRDAAARKTKVRDLLVNIIDTYADLSLASNSDEDTTRDNPILHTRFTAIVQLVVEACLAISANDFLFSTIFDKLSLHPVACGVFFECLRPLILDDQIDSLPPAVMKMFVEHFKEQNRPDIVEECVIRMDVTTMDIHQMVSLCWEHKLFDAMIYIYNQGMNDYLTPLREMMQLLQASLRARSADIVAGGALHEHLDEQELELGYKLLLYISFCLAGRAFPRGDIPKDRVRRVKWEVYRFVLMQHGEQQESATYPHLRALLQFDTKEFLNVLAIAFDESDLVANPDPSGPALPSRQVVVESLLFVMVKDNKGKNMTFSPEQVCHLFTFIARQVSRYDNIISVDRALFDQVLRRLTSTDSGRKEEQEQALLDLLDAGGMEQFEPEKLLSACEQAGFYMVCERVYASQRRYADIVPCYLRDPARQHLVFGFIHRCLKQHTVPASEAQKIKETTVDRIHDLVRVSAHDTAKLILTCFNPQLTHFARRLSSNHELFYNFLRSVFHLRDHALEGTDYNIPPELEEALVEAMCRDHPTQVYNYLRAHDHLRIEQCLVLTKKYKLIDATAWLLERKGEFLQAYSLMRETLLTQLTAYNLEFEAVERTMEQQGSAAPPDPDPREPAIKTFRKFLDVVLEMLQRCSRRMPEQKERRSIWCKTLEVLIDSQQLMRTKLRITGTDYAHVMNRHMKEVVRQMAEFVDPPAILHLIMSGGAMSDRFDDIKDLVTGMLETYNYERTQLQTTSTIIQNDVFGLLRSRQRALRHAYPSAWRCNLTHRKLYGSSAANDDIVMFRSGQCAYLSSLPRLPPRLRSGPQRAKEHEEHQQHVLDRWLESTESNVSFLQLLRDSEESTAHAWDDESADPHATKEQAALDRLRVWEQHVGRTYDAQVKPRPTAVERPMSLRPKRVLKLNVEDPRKK